VLDLRDFLLPFFNEPASPTSAGGIFSEPAAENWRRRIGEFDAFVAIVAEYNHGPTAASRTLSTAP
jgi:NAD(P)H-dependent FMN reductase